MRHINFQRYNIYKSELCVWYLDDGTIGGAAEDVKHDLEVIVCEGAALGLHLNEWKSEVIGGDPAARDSILPGAQVTDPASAFLLGALIGDMSSTSDAISGKTQLLRTMGDRLQHVSAHDALLLLRYSFAIPKLLYLLRSSPSFLSPNLKDYDDVLRSIVGTIANTHLDDNAWKQASLPVKAGGLGIRSAVQLAPSAFLSSAAASSDLVRHILPPRFLGHRNCFTSILPSHHGPLIRTILHLWLLLPAARRFGTPPKYLRRPMSC